MYHKLIDPLHETVTTTKISRCGQLGSCCMVVTSLMKCHQAHHWNVAIYCRELYFLAVQVKRCTSSTHHSTAGSTTWLIQTGAAQVNTKQPSAPSVWHIYTDIIAVTKVMVTLILGDKILNIILTS